jgi:ArsR family transcriptional regulator
MAKRLRLDPDQNNAVADLFRVLADPTRLAILQALHGGAMSVGELVDELDAKQANVSKQLGKLHDAGLLSREKDGNRVEYTIRDPMIFDLCRIVCDKLKRDGKARAKLFARV